MDVLSSGGVILEWHLTLVHAGQFLGKEVGTGTIVDQVMFHYAQIEALFGKGGNEKGEPVELLTIYIEAVVALALDKLINRRLTPHKLHLEHVGRGVLTELFIHGFNVHVGYATTVVLDESRSHGIVALDHGTQTLFQVLQVEVTLDVVGPLDRVCR